jgi:hypothetical protein
MVTTQAATFSAWAAYGSVLLDAETAAFFATRLSEAEAAEHSDGESNPPSKQKNDGSGSDEEADDDPAALVCENCGGAVPEVSLRVTCMDGSSLDVTVAQRGLVREVKRLVGQVRVVHSSAAIVCFCYGDRVDSQRRFSFADARHGPGLDRALRRR